MREREALYEEARASIVEVIAEAAAVGIDGAAPVPACPEWSVHGVVAHLTGICADVLAGNVEGVGTEEWTGAQLDTRRGASLEDLLAEWGIVAPQYAAMIDDFPGWYADQTVGDVTVHEHDIRGALGRPSTDRLAAFRLGFRGGRYGPRLPSGPPSAAAGHRGRAFRPSKSGPVSAHGWWGRASRPWGSQGT